MPFKSSENEVRNGLFLAASRTYGEQYVEPFIRHKYNLVEPSSNDHDGISTDGVKFEIKASKVLRTTKNNKDNKSLLERVLFENSNLEINRLIPFSESTNADYGANIQNVKRDHFDILIYVLLFEDCAKIFFANKNIISSGIFPNWSDKHGRYDALGKSGQFNINKQTIEWHIEHCLKDTVNYLEFSDTYRVLSETYVSKKYNHPKPD